MKLIRNDLKFYQIKSISFIIDNASCCLWEDMGLGKTITALTACVDLLNSFEISKILVIAPQRVARYTWPAEINNWTHTEHLTYKVIRGTPSQRTCALHKNVDIHIIGRELITWLVQAWGKYWPYDTVIIDEACSFKSHKSKRFKELRKTLPKINRLIELTGTPACNSEMELWSQIFLVDKGKRLGLTWTEFKKEYFDQGYKAYTFNLKPGAKEKIHNKLKDICLSLSAEDYLKMPDKITNTLWLELPTKAQLKYDELAKHCLLAMERGDVVAKSAGVLSNKLLQLCNGAVYTETEQGKRGDWEIIHNLKLDALEEIIEGYPGEPILVAYNYKTDLHRIKQKFPHVESIKDGDDVLDRWNKGEIPLLVEHPASSGFGLNLQKGGHIIVWYGLNWSLRLVKQLNARLHRQGQEKPVMVFNLAIANSVDATVLDSLEAKNRGEKDLLDALKRDLLKRFN